MGVCGRLAGGGGVLFHFDECNGDGGLNGGWEFSFLFYPFLSEDEYSLDNRIVLRRCVVSSL